MFYIFNKSTGEITSKCNYRPSINDLDLRNEDFIFGSENADISMSKIVGRLLVVDEVLLLTKQKKDKLSGVQSKIRRLSAEKLKMLIKSGNLMDKELENLYIEKEELEKELSKK